MWLKLDNGFAFHPKVVAAGPLALAIQIRAFCYASQHLTDGFIPVGMVTSLTSGMERIGIETGTIGDYAAMGCDAEEIDWPAYMVEHGLWDLHDGGYYIHDYLEWNHSKKEITSIKKQQSSGGKKAMKHRWSKALSDDNSTNKSSYNSTNKSPSISISTLNSLSSSDSDPKMKRKKLVLRAIREDDAPTDKNLSFATTLGIDPWPEWGKFKNFCLANDRHYANFEAAFRNWLANSITMNGGRR